jgi:osmotically-inducible protein OsmY
MTVVTTTRSDEQIRRDVCEEMRWDARVQPNQIGVAVHDGTVTLTGWVDSYDKKWTAERATRRVRGVRAVANDIEVRLPGVGERSDPDIAAAAAQTLEWDTLVPAERIETTVSRGWITLTGVVEWEYQRRAAERAVRRLAGVRGLTNLLGVRPRVRLDAAELRRRIEQALVRSAETDGERITVEVDAGTVVLTGTVRSPAERAEAERVAWSAPGVTTMENRVTVVP